MSVGKIAASGLLGFGAGMLLGMQAFKAVPQKMKDIVGNLEIIVVDGEHRFPLKPQIMLYYDYHYGWTQEQSFLRRDAIFMFRHGKRQWNGHAQGGDVDAIVDVIDWTDNPDAQVFVIDFCRMTWDNVEVWYKGVKVLDFLAEPTPNIELSGLGVLRINPETLDIIP